MNRLARVKKGTAKQMCNKTPAIFDLSNIRGWMIKKAAANAATHSDAPHMLSANSRL
jgi:hypothetical protein